MNLFYVRHCPLFISTVAKQKNKLSTVKISIALNAKMPLESGIAVAFAAVLCQSLFSGSKAHTHFLSVSPLKLLRAAHIKLISFLACFLSNTQQLRCEVKYAMSSFLSI